MGDGDTLVNALVGAAVTVVLAFTGFSPLLGGGVAGYLQKGDPMDCARVGALSGAIATIPLVILFGFVALFVVGGAAMSGVHGFGLALPGGILLFFLVVFALALAWNVALSAVGGYLGAYLVDEW